MNELAMRAAILDHPQMADLIEDRLSPRTMPQGTALPYITFFKISRPQSALGIKQPVYQFNIVSDDYTELLLLYEYLVESLDNVEADNVAFACHVVSERASFEDETKLHVMNVMVRFDVLYRQIYS